MNHVEHYHDWLRDAHAMEKQAESMLESMASRIDNYPDVRARIEKHINETKRQITLLEEILDRNDISRSVLKDSMSKMAALGQSIGGKRRNSSCCVLTRRGSKRKNSPENCRQARILPTGATLYP